MKKYIYLVALVLLAAGCEKEPFLTGDPGQEFGREKVTGELVARPFSARFTTIPDGSLYCLFTGIDGLEELCQTGEAEYIAGGGSITGNATHVGVIVEERSNWEVTGIEFSGDVINIGTENEPVLTQEFITEFIEGEIHSPMGDYYRYKGKAKVHIPTGNLSGKMDFDGGTGRFHGVSGSINLDGTADIAAGTATFNGKGIIYFPR